MDARNDTLTPAEQLARETPVRFPNESAEYRAARTALLAQEIELRRQIERVAAQRRALPPGGEVTGDFRFESEDGRVVGLAELFGERESLAVYSFMFGPQRERPCPMCTAFLGPLDRNARDLAEKMSLVVVARSPIARLVAFKQERGWQHLRLYRDVSDSYVKTYGGLTPDGGEVPAFNIFSRRDGMVRHFWGEELTDESADPGQDPRGAPEANPLWNVLDMIPEGRGADWYPKLDYPG